MPKIFSVLLISLFICGCTSIGLQEKQGVEKESSNQKFSILENKIIELIKKSLIAEDEEDAQEVYNEKQEASLQHVFEINSDHKVSTATQELFVQLKSHRLLSDDHNSQNNDHQNQNNTNNTNNGSSNCASEKCQTCVNNSCTSCKLGQNGQQKYLLVNGICYEQDNNTSSDQNKVDSNHKWQDYENYQAEGQVSYGGKRYKCQAGCKVCNSTADITKCSTCMDGFALNSTISKCMRCADKCVTCSSNNLQNCTSCYPGWTIDGPDNLGMFTCSKCSVDHCGQCDTVDNCTECKNFYFLQMVDSCQSCPSNCRICQDISSCTECFSGYFLTSVNAVQSCVLCASGCALCTDLTNCVKCYPGFFTNLSTNSCEKCSQNCWECSSTTNCTRCVMGYEMINNICVSYIQDCAIMNTDSTCQKCFQGYSLNDSNSQCVENNTHSDYVCGQNQYLQNTTCLDCGVTVNNCQSCNNETCLKCKPEYFRENNGTTCTLCQSSMIGCLKCDNSIFCSQCVDGYYMDQDKNGTVILSYGNCIKCDTNCLTCNQKSIYCTSCNTGYSLSTARTCVPTNQFSFTLLLNIDLNQFPSKIAQFKTDLANLIQDGNVSNAEKQKFVQITKIASGSILIQGTFAASSSDALKSTKSSFDSSLASGSTFSGIQVLSSKSEENSPSNQNNDSSSSSSNTGMIVGIVVGIVCAAIIITAIVVYFCCCKKSTQQTEEINFDEKRSRSTLDDFAANQMIQDHELNQFHANPPAKGPDYFV